MAKKKTLSVCGCPWNACYRRLDCRKPREARMQGKVFLTSTGYDPALGREVRDPTLEGAMSGDAADVVAELDAELALIEPLPYRVPIHHLARRARDEIVGLRGLLEHSDRTVVTAIAVATPAIRDEALEEAAQVCELSAEIMQPDERRLGDAIAVVKSCAAAIRKLKGEGHG